MQKQCDGFIIPSFPSSLVCGWRERDTKGVGVGSVG
ncbi:hypothetical protein E2C01_095436 [Portunus trituberculatus]|uniref:Uncharacterized protein n=1 Tax=Portunus trituberculatus TaxID=210409 RepID=A0A5B7JYQ1_PORTR|nr:hypothetical protein [Portunus trituberculatus]